MTEEDEEFNRIEREAKQRMEAVSAALDKKAENARELGLDYEPAQQEPVAWVCEGSSFDEKHGIDYWPGDVDDLPIGTPLYTPPPAQRTWVGLTDEEVDDFLSALWPVGAGAGELLRAIEAKLKEKNT